MPKSDGAIFRVEEINGEKYRVMYFKNNRGGYTRSKFIKKLGLKKSKKKPNSSKTRLKKYRTKQQPIQIEEPQVQQQIETQRPTIRNKIYSNVRLTEKFQPPQESMFIKRSGSSQNLIDKWKSFAQQ